MKISIVIPTRNRCEFLPYCLRTALACKDDQLEVVISNNNSSDETAAVLKGFTDPRLKVVHTNADLSMRQNFEFALSHATGDYVIFIGDDDGVLPSGLAALRHLIENAQPDAIIWRHITYLWPNKTGGPVHGQLKFRCRDFCGPVYPLAPRALLDDLCQGNRMHYRDGLNIYHGCIARRVIDQVKCETGGDYFQGQCPDINTAFSNLTAAQSAYWIRNPATIAGAGEKSHGSTMKKNSNAKTQGQKNLVNNFDTLAKSDDIAPEASCEVQSLLAHTYANLERVLRTHQPDTASINHQAWREAIINELKNGPMEHQRWSLIETLFKQIDPNYEIQKLEQTGTTEPADQTTQSPTTSPMQKYKTGRVAKQHLANVATVVGWLERVIGRAYYPSRNVPIALMNQAGRSVGMSARIPLANMQTPDALMNETA